MFCVFVLKNLKNKRLCIGLSDDFDQEFKNHPQSVLISLKAYRDKKEAVKFEKYLKSKKGLNELKAKIKRKSLGVMG